VSGIVVFIVLISLPCKNKSLLITTLIATAIANCNAFAVLCVCMCVQEAHEELRMLQRKGAVAPPSLVPHAGEDDYNRTLHDDRLLSADSFDFTRSKPLTPDPGTIAATAHIHKCPGRRQGKSGFSGMCEIFNEFELHFQVCLLDMQYMLDLLKFSHYHKA
jgi:hypothetical protein